MNTEANDSCAIDRNPHVLDELVHVTAQRRAALTTTTKGTNQ